MSKEHYIIVTLHYEGSAQTHDIELATNVPIGDICTIITSFFGWFTNRYQEYDVVAIPEGRVLNKAATFADERIIDGSQILLRSHQPVYGSFMRTGHSVQSGAGFTWKQVS